MQRCGPVSLGLPPQVRGEQFSDTRDLRGCGLTPAGAGRTSRRLPRKPQIVGLPPQVRGEPAVQRQPPPLRRLTPAGAGRTTPPVSAECARGAYPRRCGENFSSPRVRQRQEGLPPQVRGEPLGTDVGTAQARLTPAGAGRTALGLIAATLPAAYPRRCGENPAAIVIEKLYEGLPPQVRGEPQRPPQDRGPSGLTPAGAGRTGGAPDSWKHRWAYPRRCGENTFASIPMLPQMGLPPQVRGEPAKAFTRWPNVRLTPAGAGRTPSERPSASSIWAYPRRCGENRTRNPTRGRTRGLPPQVRGEPRRHHAHAAPVGLTPAGAGRTSPQDYHSQYHLAYPRRCGENVFGLKRPELLSGLPPQVRGEQAPQPADAWPSRLTPAGAGRTWRWVSAWP